MPTRLFLLFLLAASALPLAAQTRPATDPLAREIETRMTDVMPKVIAWRRDIHQHPELSFEETRTASASSPLPHWRQGAGCARGVKAGR